MIVFSNQILIAFSLYDLRCIILTIRKQIIAFKKGTFAPPAPPTQRQEGRLLPLPPSPACLRAFRPVFDSAFTLSVVFSILITVTPNALIYQQNVEIGRNIEQTWAKCFATYATVDLEYSCNLNGFCRNIQIPKHNLE